jgi:DNA-binding MarR family transcriptional regulator
MTALRAIGVVKRQRCMMVTIGNVLTSEPVTREHAATLLRTAVGRANRRLRQHADDGLTPSQVAVLAAIARYGSLTPSGIADLERISRPTATKIVAKLRERGLVTAVEDETDRRSYLLTLSPDGTALRELRRSRKNAYLKKLLRNATDDEVALLANAAAVLLHLLQEDGR